jgi:hypothetical protein
MTTSFTLFRNIYDNKTHRSMSFDSFDGFERLLYRLSEQPGYKPKKGERKPGSPLISPASYTSGSTRGNDNVVKWNGWAALDVDDYEGGFDAAMRVFSEYYYVCYSTASSTKEHPKFRVVFPCTSPVAVDKIRHFWYAMNTEFDTLGDKQTKDVSRMYYVPAQYPGAFNFIFSNAGEIVNPYDMMGKHPYTAPTVGSSLGGSLPNEIQIEIAKSRWQGLGNPSAATWTGLQDCPFVNQKLVGEYGNLPFGWYSKMYSIMVSIASNAIRAGHQIHRGDVVTLCKELDASTGNWYQGRAWDKEAQRAIDYALMNA